MSKRARRLWFGDWQQGDQEPSQPFATHADDGDTVRLIPVDDRDSEWRAERRRKLARAVGIPIAIALLLAIGLALSPGGDGDQLSVVGSEQIPQAQTPQLQLPQTPQVPQGAPPQGFGGPDLTSDAADKAAAAALKKFPGDIERVTSGPGGDDYVVHVIQGDGNEVHVLVSPEFKVEGSDANSGPRNFGPGTPG